MDDTVSIVQFLQRPIKLAHKQLTATDNTQSLAAATFGQEQPAILQWNLPYDILSKGGKLEKASNHQYFKADIKVKVVLNTNPFIAGRFWLTYSPYEDDVVPARQQRYASRAGVTAYPGVEIDAQLDNTVEILIPYASYKEAYVLTSDTPENFVKLSLYPLTPVLGPQTASPGVIDMAFYAWFENVTLNIPTCKALTQPQVPFQLTTISNVDKNRLSQARKLEKLEKTNPSVYEYIQRYLNPTKNLRKTRDIPEGVDIPDSWPGVRRIDANMQVQAEDTSSGPISGIASIVGGIADAASKIPIPIVGEIASGVSWVANIVGNIAGIFGWSRPTHMKEICEVSNVPGKNYTHVEAIDMGVNLSLSNRNELDKAYSIFPSAADEMDLGYCCANPALKEVYVWNVASGVSGSLHTIGVIPVGIGPFNRYTNTASGKLCPQNQIVVRNSLTDSYQYVRKLMIEKGYEDPETSDITITPYAAASIALLDTAPCEYISQLFMLWRATMCFKISVVKTAFHSGRLEIFFDPGPYFSTPGGSPDLDRYDEIDTTNNYKYILDLTNDTEVTIRVPFVSEQLFKRTLAANKHASDDTALLPPISPKDIFDSMIGSLVVKPVSNLLAPETVAQQVHILVWKWAEDVVFGVPKNVTQSNLFIVDGKNPPSGQVPCPDKVTLSQVDIESYKMVIGNQCKAPPPTQREEYPGRKNVVMQINISNKADGNVITFFETVNIEEENMKACKNALGERITNLRPLLRCFRTIYDSVECTLAKPFIHDFQEDFMNKNDFHTDYVSYLSYMYRFFRGGNRIKYLTSYTPKPNPEVGTEWTRVISNIAQKGRNAFYTGPSHVTFPDLNPVHEVTIPFYSQYRKLPISPPR